MGKIIIYIYANIILSVYISVYIISFPQNNRGSWIYGYFILSSLVLILLFSALHFAAILLNIALAHPTTNFDSFSLPLTFPVAISLVIMSFLIILHSLVHL